MTKVNFIAAIYNELDELQDLVNSVYQHVDKVFICNDGSTDNTLVLLDIMHSTIYPNLYYKTIEHTGLPETVKNEALAMIPQEDKNSWVLMLDADERIEDSSWGLIDTWLAENDDRYDYVYFDQLELIDGAHVRTFQKCKLFKTYSVTFPLNNIHADDQFTGRGIHMPWKVFHRKSTYKQIQRETEYIETYKKLLNAGLIDEGRYKWLIGLHHYVKLDDLTLLEEKGHNEDRQSS